MTRDERYDYHRERRFHFEAKGFCTRCGRNPAAQDKTKCKKCLKDARDRMRARRPERHYVASNPEYDRILELQRGTCACCPFTPEGKQRLLQDVDGKRRVKGLVCVRCATALKAMGRNRRIARKLANYLSN